VPWTTSLGTPRHDGSATESLPPSPGIQWTRDVGRAVRGTPAIGRDVLVLGLVERHVMLLERETGAPYWRSSVSGTIRGGPLLRDDRVFVATEATPAAHIYALRLSDGRPAWRTASDGVSAPLALDGDALFAGTERGVVLRLAARTGDVVWHRRLFGSVRAAPVPTPAGLVVATTADTLYLLDPTSGAIVRQRPTPGPVVAPPATDGGRLYLGTLRGVVQALPLTTLDPDWEVQLPDAIYGTPALAGDTLYALARDGTLAIVPVSDPAAHRTLRLGVVAVAGPTVTRSGVLIGTVSGEVLLIDPATGVALWRDEIAGPIETPPLLRDGQLVVVGGRGDIHTYR